jgi:hypothetical protein
MAYIGTYWDLWRILGLTGIYWDSMGFEYGIELDINGMLLNISWDMNGFYYFTKQWFDPAHQKKI